jgi:ADP-ribose pyrophosphatase YjhB (NUDIX family)
MTDRYTELVARLQALARTGLHFCQAEYDRDRYEQIERIAAELLAGPDPGGQAGLLELWARETGYVTPKMEVRGAVFDSVDRVLLVRERADQLWTLPGGWADVHESPSQSVEKEIEQESGFVTHAVKLAALLDRSRHGHGPSPFHSWKAFFLCEVVGGQPRGSYETDAVDFFPLDRLPPMSLGRSTPEQVLQMHRHWTARGLPTEFD